MTSLIGYFMIGTVLALMTSWFELTPGVNHRAELGKWLVAMAVAAVVWPWIAWRLARKAHDALIEAEVERLCGPVVYHEHLERLERRRREHEIPKPVWLVRRPAHTAGRASSSGRSMGARMASSLTELLSGFSWKSRSSYFDDFQAVCDERGTGFGPRGAYHAAPPRLDSSE